jgi:SpoVK/Ycf46/Vps4 family AAA+-type ATPase
MKKRFNLNVRVLSTLVEPLEELQRMVGMAQIKTAIYEKIILYLQGIENRNRDFLHTVLYGGPGMGKTEVAKIIGKIYAKMGLLSKGDFKEVRLTDLKAGYVGQSELKTQKVLDDARGCVLFMDEAYSLGSEEKMDQFSQGIIDLINPYMDKYKDDFVFIVAGYRDELEHRFFRGNQGLKSRFGLWLEIDEYKGAELREIFLKKVLDYEWSVEPSGIPVEFFDKNRKSFPFFGRDVENLFSKCKVAHAKRVLYRMPEDKKKVTAEDLEEGFKIYTKDRSMDKKDTAFEEIKKMMYM